MDDIRSEATASGGPAAKGLGLDDLVTLYMQQYAALNQLWAMYAVTTFAAGAFAFNVGEGEQAAWLLLAGAAGFFLFTCGHGLFVVDGMERLRRAASDIGSVAGQCGARPPTATVHYLARKVRTTSSILVHILIDLCVFAAFSAQLYGLGWFGPAPDAAPPSAVVVAASAAR